MGYCEKNLVPGEEIVYRAHLHLIIFLSGMIFVLLGADWWSHRSALQVSRHLGAGRARARLWIKQSSSPATSSMRLPNSR